MMIDVNDLKTKLHESEVMVKFTKADGTERIMRCSLNDNFIPSYEFSGKKIQNPDVLPVWDIENMGWRSFRLDSVISYTVKE
jgi:hypothetical protein